jgi:ribosomal protein S10
MFLLNIKTKTKNQLSLKFFFKFLIKLCKNKKLILNLPVVKFLNYKYNKQNKIITVLTSPQANKNAQEQFLLKSYSKKAFIFSFKILKLLILLKKIKKNLFSDIKIQLNFLFSKKISKKINTKIFNPEKFKLNYIKK